MIWFPQEVERNLRELLPAEVSKTELKENHREAVKKWKRSRHFRWMLVPYSIVVFGLFISARMLAAWWFGANASLATFIIGWVAVAVAMLAFYALARSEYRRQFRIVVRSRGFEVCGNCGYYLAPLKPDITKCPECGEIRQPMPVPDRTPATD